MLHKTQHAPTFHHPQPKMSYQRHKRRETPHGSQRKHLKSDREQQPASPESVLAPSPTAGLPLHHPIYERGGPPAQPLPSHRRPAPDPPRAHPPRRRSRGARPVAPQVSASPASAAGVSREEEVVVVGGVGVGVGVGGVVGGGELWEVE